MLADNGFAFAVADDAALIWLDPNTRTLESSAAAFQILQANKAALGIDQILDGQAIASSMGDPKSDMRAPDFIVLPSPGIIYTGGSKLAEHGGVTEDDRHVAMLVSAAGLSLTTNSDRVSTTQIAPTILEMLHLPTGDLQAVKLEGTATLPGLSK